MWVGVGAEGENLPADSPQNVQPDVGLHPATHEVVTWAQTESLCSTDWATQGPLTVSNSSRLRGGIVFASVKVIIGQATG